MDFEVRFRELESMTGSDVSMDLFNQEYQHLLDEARALPYRFEKLQRMKHLLLHQAEYLMNEWLRSKAIDKLGGSPREITTQGMN